MKTLVQFSALGLIIAGCGGSGGLPDLGEDQVRYQVKFISEWSEDTHPDGIPEDPHFSTLIGGVHSEEFEFWVAGEKATEGIKEMAENGKTSPLDAEMEAKGSKTAYVFTGDAIDSPAETTFEIVVSPDFPFVTLVTMIAPSPDWFIGVHDLDLRDGEGEFEDSLSVDLFAYDAGTEEGDEFDGDNDPTEPAEDITRLTGGDFDTRFGRFVFTKIDNE